MLPHSHMVVVKYCNPAKKKKENPWSPARRPMPGSQHQSQAPIHKATTPDVGSEADINQSHNEFTDADCNTNS